MAVRFECEWGEGDFPDWEPEFGDPWDIHIGMDWDDNIE